jgi:putative redox protein
MKKLKFTFKNAAGEELAGLAELPENPKAFALLAHCFTCGKDLKGAARIARKLTENAIAVLRFDFTGLGNSEGDFPTPTSHQYFGPALRGRLSPPTVRSAFFAHRP